MPSARHLLTGAIALFALSACKDPATEHLERSPPTSTTPTQPLVDISAEPALPLWESHARALLQGGAPPPGLELTPDATRYRECLSCWREPIEAIPLTTTAELPQPPRSFTTVCDPARRCCHLEGLEATTVRAETVLHAVCFDAQARLAHAATFTPRRDARSEPPRRLSRFYTNGQAFYLVRPEAVFELTFPAMTVREVATTPPIDVHRCPSALPEQRPLTHIAGVEEARLTLTRTSPCGANDGAFITTEHQVDLTTLAIRQPHPISALAQSGDDIFIGDAGTCDNPLALHTPGTLFRSSDDGRSFTLLPISGDTGPADTPVAELLSDPAQPGHLVVRTAHCPNSHAPFGAQLYTTTDAGETFDLVELPERIAAGLHPLQRVWRVGDTLSDLAIYDGQISWRRTTDGSWTPAPDLTPPPPTRRIRARDGYVLRISSDGLLRYLPDLLGGFERITPL